MAGEKSDAGRQVTQLLHDWRAGDRAAAEELFRALYRELRIIAANRLRAERGGHTLQPTALVNELYLRLADREALRIEDRGHFFAIAARTMRRILIDYERARKANKRGGDLDRLSLSVVDQFKRSGSAEDLTILDDALSRLYELQPRAVHVVELRCFAGLQEREISALLGVSVNTVNRDWRFARAWLRSELACMG